ncbi:MAG: hypothetical protein PHH07_05330 [Candidatus Cloacimonetes bacterium]|nr:hypothetical protein [Candidatus Cloacimonadota bacterium]
MRRILPLLILLLAFFSACDREEATTEKLTPLAEVNGDVLTLEGFRSTFTDEQWNNLSSEQKKQEIENWVNLTLLAQEAEAQKLDGERAVKQRMDYAAKKIKANALISKRLASIAIGEEELFNYYRIHQSEFQSKLMEYDIQRILCSDAASAASLLQRLKKDGYDFDLAVAEHSQEALKNNKGRMGFVTASGSDSLFWRAAHELPANTPGMASINGKTYILRHVQQREGTQDANFAEYQAEIRSILLKERKQQVYQELIRELKMKTPEIYYY